MPDSVFKAERIIVSHKQLLKASTEKVFPLLCPKREYDWIEHWDCSIISPEQGFAELDGIFVTEFPGEEKEVWYIDRYEPNSLIEFIKTSESKAVRYTITLDDLGNGTTSANWSQVITALNETGNKFIKSVSAEEFSKKIQGIEKLLNHYLVTGEMLKN